MNRIVLAAAFACAAASSAQAIVLDGAYDTAYGAATAHVTYSAAAPNSNFGTPTNLTDRSSYDIYLTSDANFVYGYMRATGDAPIVATFANVYFNSDMSNGNGVGSDIGFNISTSSQRIFVPNESLSIATGGITVAESGDGLGIEFAIANALFTTRTAGIAYDAGFVDPVIGSTIQLRLSQSFGYSVAGGASYGNARLGVVTLGGAVPEPASWAMMVGGFALVGSALRRRAKGTARFA